MLFDVGTRDETDATSGALTALKATHLKTLRRSNETVNYSMIQLAGSDLIMDYDQERTFIKTSCA